MQLSVSIFNDGSVLVTRTPSPFLRWSLGWLLNLQESTQAVYLDRDRWRDCDTHRAVSRRVAEAIERAAKLRAVRERLVRR